MNEQEARRRVIENPNDGTSQFKARVVWGEGVDTILRAMFVDADMAHEYVHLESRLTAALVAKDSLAKALGIDPKTATHEQMLNAVLTSEQVYRSLLEDYHATLAAKEEAEREYRALGDRYGRMVEQVARLVPVVVKGEPWLQLTNAQVIERTLAALAASEARASKAEHELADEVANAELAWHRVRKSEMRAGEMRAALNKINDVRNSIVGYQSVNWSAHIYPIVAALNEAGFKGWEYDESKMVARTQVQRIEELEARAAALEGKLAMVEKERDRDMLTVERITNLIDGYQWLAEGRGPYAYDDAGYDDDVMHFVQSLVESLDSGRWQNIQHFMSEYESAKMQAAASEARAAVLKEYKALADEMAAYMHEPAYLDAENWECANKHRWPIVHPVTAVYCPECGRGPVATDSKFNKDKFKFSKKDWLARYDALTPSSLP